MKTFTVVMPFTGIAIREIEAETEAQAVAQFLNTSTFPTVQEDLETDVHIAEWELTDVIVKGNVFYGIQNEFEIIDQHEHEI